MGTEDFTLEDAVLDDLHEGYDILERPLSGRLFILFGAITVLVALLFVGRTAYFGLAKNGQFASRAYANAGQEIILRAPRGIIYDRYGIPLVKNEASFNVSLNLSELFKQKEKIGDILSAVRSYVEYDMNAAQEALEHINLETQSYLILARNVPLQSIIELKKAQIPAVIVEDGFSRSYTDAEMFAHVVGYTGLVSADDLQGNANLDLNDEIGKSGIEFMYDKYLRGENGSRIILRDAQNNLLGERVDKTVQSGAKVYTTIDAELQKVLYTSLKNRLTSLDRNAGAGLAINPRTGEVLALVSLPSFDTNKLTGEIFSDPAKPAFNRVLSGVYSPGSIIKPLVAFGALEEGIVDPMTSILSTGYIELPNPYTPSQPSRFVDWKAHGWVNVYSALARSSNVYFYEVGGGFEQQQGLGIERLRAYWGKFLLGEKTGIDLPGEAQGNLPDPESKEKRTGQIWRIGDTYNVSIGQGDLLVSPIELLRYIGGIAAKGKLYEPYVVSKVENGESLYYTKDQRFNTIEQKNPQSIEDVERGMLYGVSEEYGTSHMLAGIPMAIAGKTGSAQIQNNQKTNAFFVGYAPVPNPEIAILVLIEDAKEGSLNAVPVAQEVLSWYYEHRVSERKTDSISQNTE